MGLKFELGLFVGVAALGVAALGIQDRAVQATPKTEQEAKKEAPEEETYKPTQQAALNKLVREEGQAKAFTHAFEAGDELTELSFTAAQGVGAHVGEGRLFARAPRADLKGKTEWASHVPAREGGPNATSCIACHNAPIANGAGDIATNVLVDPAHSGQPSTFLERNTLPLFALGVPQRLAEEMSVELRGQKRALKRLACQHGHVEGRLSAKGVTFGAVSVRRTAQSPCQVAYDWSRLEGVDRDLTIKAFGWKGNKTTIRQFTRDAAHNELGLQAVEIAGNQDGDFDGVSNELTVGDLTALAVYMAGLERPVTKLELAELNLAVVSPAERKAINRGERLFDAVGCASCHVPEMTLSDPTYSEPSKTPGFFDVTFPSGAKPSDLELKQELAIVFDMTADQPNNRIKRPDGKTHLLGSLRKAPGGGALANWYTDFKRHDMGPELADPADPLGIGASMWLTRSLAGVGSTGPWLHDGRATTLEAAIMAHGGEAARTRDKFAALPAEDREAMVAFLKNLVIFKQEE